MANSDNVVRGGLTPKLKDKDTLFEMLPYDSMSVERTPVKGVSLYSHADGSQVTDYKTGFEEFRVVSVKVSPSHADDDISLRFKSFSMVIVTEGSGVIEVPGYGVFPVEAYCAYYVMPDCEFKIRNKGEDQ